MADNAARVIPATHGSSAPPAVWSAFARNTAWKNWLMLGQFFIIVLLIFTCLKIARTEPDVVVVDQEGKSTYLQRNVAGAELIRFIAQQKQLPSDLTILRFSKEFIGLMFAVNSSTIEGAYPQALAMMDEKVREATRQEYAKAKIVDAYKAAKMQTQLKVEDLVLVQKTDALLHLRATISRFKSSLIDGANGASDRLQVELVERVVPRSVARPDGLEVAELSVKTLPTADATTKTAEGAHAP